MLLSPCRGTCTPYWEPLTWSYMICLWGRYFLSALVFTSVIIMTINVWRTLPPPQAPKPAPPAFRYFLQVSIYKYMYTATAESLQSCPTLCDPIDGSPPGSPVPGILRARTLEWVAISFSNAWKWKVKVKVKSCLTLSDPMNCSPPGSSIHGIFQARVLEWGAIAVSKRTT